jgi:choice-of-anchor A domain-containing protein
VKRALLLALLLAAPASADLSLGICSTLTSARCTLSTSWSVQETATTPQLTNPANAAAGFQIVVTEGQSARTLTASDVLALDGLIQSGTRIGAIFVSVQKGDGAGGFTTVASAAVGDTAHACGCPYVASSMTLAAHDAAGTPLAGTPLVSLGYGGHAQVGLDLSWDLGQGLVQPGDVLRLQPCVTYLPDQVSFAPGCMADGGGVRATKACTQLPLASCTAAQPAQLVETLGGLSTAVATLGSFTATTSSPALSPASIAQTPGGAAVSFTATPSGVAGTQSTVLVQGRVSCGSAAGTGLFGDSATIGTSSAAASIGVTCLAPGGSCGDLGLAAPFGVFAAHGFAGTSGGAVQGALAAGGDVSLSGYAVGTLLSGGGLSSALVSGGNLAMTASGVTGDAWVAGTASLSSSSVSGALHAPATHLDFAGAQSHLLALSTQLAALSANGTVTVRSNGTTLSGADPSLDVFALTTAALAAAPDLIVSVPASAVAVINVTGAAGQLLNTAFHPGALSPQQLVLNFPAATSLAISGVGLGASVLAPLAAVRFDNGVLQGQVLAGSFAGGGQVALDPLVSCIPLPPAPASIGTGDFCTYTQGGWAATCRGANAGCFRDAHFAATFTAPLPCGSEHGLILGSGPVNRACFGSAAAVQGFLPTGSTAGTFTSTLCDPTSSPAGVAAGQLLSLKLSVGFSDAGLLPKKNGVALGELVMLAGPCAGFTVRQILARGETAISGAANPGTACTAIGDLGAAADTINNNFDGCTQNQGALRLP